MILIYREKNEQEEKTEADAAAQEKSARQAEDYQNTFSSKLIEAKNLIFHGAPGTGKSYLAREIAADIVSNGYYKEYSQLSDEQKKQIEFVQFHPNYDYSDFVEGLRPKVNDDGTMGFELQDGIFKNSSPVPERIMRTLRNQKKLLKKKCQCRKLWETFFPVLSSVQIPSKRLTAVNSA